jgi:hypothetical protein
MRECMVIRFVGAILIAGILLLQPCFAGSLEPSDPPGPTMCTLDEIYNKPIWKMFDKDFVDWPNNSRFAIYDVGTPYVWDDAVLDKETGIVWLREPRKSLWGNLDVRDWYGAQDVCNDLYLCWRKGWRLPTISELGSLIEGSELPNGHPFSQVVPACYWSATTCAGNIIKALCSEMPGAILRKYDKTEQNGVWCVRGGQGVDPQ